MKGKSQLSLPLQEVSAEVAWDKSSIVKCPAISPALSSQENDKWQHSTLESESFSKLKHELLTINSPVVTEVKYSLSTSTVQSQIENHYFYSFFLIFYINSTFYGNLLMPPICVAGTHSYPNYFPLYCCSTLEELLDFSTSNQSYGEEWKELKLNSSLNSVLKGRREGCHCKNV